MTLDLGRIAHEVDQYYGNLPHPQAPRIKLKDYDAFKSAAEAMTGVGKATPQDVAHIHETLTRLEISPQDFVSTWKKAKPIANRLLGREPGMDEIKDLAGAHPQEYHDYFGHQPHPAYPEVKAMDMARYYHAAEPIARKLAGRAPSNKEVARFALAGYTSEDIASHFGGGW